MIQERASIDELRKILSYIAKGYKISDIVYDTIFQVAKREVEDKGKIVLIKRDPNVHRGRIQAVYVKVIEGETIDIHPASVASFGADFDGDTMAVYAPMTEDAQLEAKKNMVSAVGATSINEPNFSLSKEMLTGIFTMTYEENTKLEPILLNSSDEALKLEISTPVIIHYKGVKVRTTAGRVVFNRELPEYIEYINEPVDKKKINSILSKVIRQNRNEFIKVMDGMMQLGFRYATMYPRTISLSMLSMPPEIDKLKEKLAVEKDLVTQQKLLDEMTVIMIEFLKKEQPHIYQQIKAGAIRDIIQVRQVLVAKGLMSDPEGNMLPPVTKAMNDGYTAEEYFNAASGSRRGIASRAHLTSYGGYAYRKMIYVMGNLKCDINKGNCGTKRTLNVKLNKDLYSRLQGRYVQDSNGVLKNVDESMIGSIINLRSPVFCKSSDICRTCYGDLINQINTSQIGILSAMEVASLSEKIMKCSDGLIHYNGMMIPFIDFYDIMNTPETIDDDGVKSKYIQESIDGKDGLVNVCSVQKHDPTDKMLFISTKSGHTLVCQQNHPLWIKLNNLHDRYDNRTCRLVGNELYATTGSGNSELFEIEDCELMQVEASDLKKYDSIWIDATIATNEVENPIIPGVDGYLIGSNLTNDEEKYPYMVKGDQPWNKRLFPQFLAYNKDWLRDCISGILDETGTTFNNPYTTARIHTTSYYLLQQIKAICIKLDYKCSANVVHDIGLENNKNKRPHFVIDISFFEGSIIPNSKKLKRLNFKFVKRLKDERPIKGFDVITCIKEMPLWNYPVYDVKSETSEYMLGFVQNHNSFHMGGGVDVEVSNILEELMYNMESSYEQQIKDSFEQKSNDLITKADYTMLVIDKSIFQNKYKIERKDENIHLPLGYFNLFMDKLEIPTTIESPVIVYTHGLVEEDDHQIVINYTKDQKVFNIIPKIIDPSEVAGMLDELVGGKSPWTTVESLYWKFYKVLGPTGGWDSTHLECILSNILRYKRDPMIAARLKEPYEPVTYSIKRLPGLISWTMGLAFEDYTRALSVGLVSDRGPESEIEKVMFGEPLTDIKKM